MLEGGLLGEAPSCCLVLLCVAKAAQSLFQPSGLTNSATFRQIHRVRVEVYG